MTEETYIIGTEGINEDLTPKKKERKWECNACGYQTCVVRGGKPTECTKVANIPKSKWKEEKE